MIEETHNADFDIIAKLKKNLTSKENDISPVAKKHAGQTLDLLMKKFRGMTEHITERLNKIFGDPDQKKKMKEPIKRTIQDLLVEKKKEADVLNSNRTIPTKKKQHYMGR